jgi:serine/threonine-protein kinase
VKKSAQPLDGRYELEERIGGGAAGDVYRAVDRQLDRVVAIKFVRAASDIDDVARARFEREARTGARFSHPNSINIFDVGEAEDGRPYLVMEHVDGETLAERIERSDALPADEALEIACHVVSALAAAHEAGLVHRDVKPSNILLGADGAARLADFGIAKAIDDVSGRMTLTGEVLGTAHYLAPELMTGGRATPRSDVYSVGVVLYEMLSSRPPFDGRSPAEVLAAAQRGEVEPLEREDVDAQVVSAMYRALDRDPSRRPVDGGELLALLQAAGDPGATIALTPNDPATDRLPVLPVPARSKRAPRRKRAFDSVQPRVVVGAIVAAIVVSAIVALASFGNGGSPSRSTQGLVPPAPGEEPVNEATDPTIESVIAEIDDGPYLLGAQAEQLRARLVTLQDQLGTFVGPRDARATRLLRTIDEWVFRGELNADLAVRAKQAIRGEIEG